MCGAGGILPTSYTFLPHLLNVDSEPFVVGAYGDEYKGTLNGSKVCIKRIQVYVKDGPQEAARVRCRRHRFLCSPSIMKPIDLLSRGHNVETLNTPKHRAPTGYHNHSLPAHFGLDAWREPAGIY